MTSSLTDRPRPSGPRHAADDTGSARSSWSVQGTRPASLEGFRPAVPPGGGPRHAVPDLPDVGALDVATAPTASPADRAREVELFASEVRRAIAAEGCTLRQLETMLDAYGADFRSSIGTLSAWQSGTTTPPATESGLNRVLALERCLNVPAGDLAILIPGDLTPVVTRPLTQISVHNRPARADLAERHKQFQQIINRLTGPQRTIPVTTAKKYVLGRNHRPTSTVITHRLRAGHDHVDRYWFLHAPTARTYPTITTIAGCTRGRIVHEDDVLRSGGPRADGGYKLVAVELLFSRVLTRGEPYEFTFSIGYDTTTVPAENLFRHIQLQPCQSLDLELQFQYQRPEQLQQARWTADLRPIQEHHVQLDAHGTDGQVIDNPVPGAYGWIWAGGIAGGAAVDRPNRIA